MSGADGRSRGFGTVRYATVADAEYAIENINGSDMGGRELIVREDNGGKGAGEGGGRGRGGGRGGGFRDSPFGGKGGLDDDLDSYFAAKSAPAEPAAE